MDIILTILLGLLIIIGSILSITLNLVYKPIIKEYLLEYEEREYKNGNIK